MSASDDDLATTTNSLNPLDWFTGGGSVIPDWVSQVGERGIALITNPKNAVLSIIVGFLGYDIVEPIFVAIYRIGKLLISIPVTVVYGTDQRIGWLSSGSVGDSAVGFGIADVPVYIARLVIEALSPVVQAVFGVIRAFNGSVVTLTLSAGLAGPPVAAALITVEIGLGLYLGWAVLQIIDIPGIQLSGIARVATAPLRTLTRVFR